MPGPVEVTYGQLEYDDQLAEFQDQSPDGSSGHTDYMARNYFEQDGLTYAGSLAGPSGAGPAVGIVRLGNPVTIWICEFSACCLGSIPTLPDPEAPPPGWVLMDAYITMPYVSSTAGGAPLYRVKGVYVYSRENPTSKVFEGAFFPQPPWVPLSAFPRKVPADKLVRWISSPQQQGGGGGFGPTPKPPLPPGGGVVVT